MNTKEKGRKSQTIRRKLKPDARYYTSAEAASAAKIDKAARYIDRIDLAVFRKNGHVE